jgi:hypothetical protein
VKNRELSSKATAISSEQMGRLLNEKDRLADAWPSKNSCSNLISLSKETKFKQCLDLSAF